MLIGEDPLGAFMRDPAVRVDGAASGPLAGLRARPRRVVVRDDGGTRYAVAVVPGRWAARRLRGSWTRELQDGVTVHELSVPDDVPGRLRPDLLDPEGFGDVQPDEIAG